MWYAEKTRLSHIVVRRIFICRNKYLALDHLQADIARITVHYMSPVSSGKDLEICRAAYLYEVPPVYKSRLLTQTEPQKRPVCCGLPLFQLCDSSRPDGPNLSPELLESLKRQKFDSLFLEPCSRNLELWFNKIWTWLQKAFPLATK